MVLPDYVPVTPPAVIAPDPGSSRDEFPRRRRGAGADGNGPTIPPARRGGVIGAADPRSEFPDNRRGTGGPVPRAPRQVREYWATLQRSAVDPEIGDVFETDTVDVYVDAGPGEIDRLFAAVAVGYLDWELVKFNLAEDPFDEF